MTIEQEDVLRRSYEAFNARDLDAALATMHPDVDWPDMLGGRRILGRDAVRTYWLEQFEVIDPHVEPLGFTTRDGGLIAAEVHQVVRTRYGEVVADSTVEHVYTFRSGLVVAMDVYLGGELPSAPRTSIGP